ncbi:MAG: hypothetical protein AB1894_21740 [Chloroflexota bacterium]
MKRVNSLLCIFCVFLLVSCQKTNAVTTSTAAQSVGPSTLAPYVFKTSKPGAITVHGKIVVMNPMAWLPDSNDAVFLVPIPSDEQAIMTIPEFKVGEVPQAEVDESTGEFMFTNIEPGQYAVVVLEKSGRQMPVRLLENDSSVIIVLKETDRDQTIELGYLRFP